MASAIYNNYKVLALSGDVDFIADTIMVMLLSGNYSLDVDAHTVTGDIPVNTEVTGAGYTMGGKEIESRTVSGHLGADHSVFDGADVTWSSSTITCSGAAVYVSGTNPYLIGYIDFGSTKTSSAGDFTIQWNAASGILNFG